MAWVPTQKGTLLIPSGTSHDPERKHLFVICALTQDEALLATITSWTNDLCDDACILDAGAHPFIIAKSYILYRKCRIEKCQTLATGVKNSVLIPRDAFSDAPFKRICEGIGKSKQISWKIRKAFNKWG